MRKLGFAILFMLALNLVSGKAQTLTTYTIVHTGSLANCAPVVAGQTQSCYAKEGLAVSVNGAPYVLVPLSVAVTGLQAIIVNGTSCTGPTCSLTIPTKAVVPTQNLTLQ